jgi:hypothetical protein
MPFTVTLNASALVQDTSLATPVTVANDAKTDQETAQDEFYSSEITVPAAAVDQLVDLTGLDIRSLYVKSSQAVTMKQGASTFAQPIRSLFMATFGTGQGPASLKFSNAGAVAAQVRIIAGSKNP